MRILIVAIIVIAAATCDQSDMALGNVTQLVCESTCKRQAECGNFVPDCVASCVSSLCSQGYDCDELVSGDPGMILQCVWDVRSMSCDAPTHADSCGELR